MGDAIRAIQAFNTVKVSASITRPANTTAYAAGDVYADDTDDELFTFQLGGKGNHANSGTVMAVHAICDNAADAPDVDLLLFSEKPSLVADNAAANYSVDELDALIGKVSLGQASWDLYTGARVCEVRDLNLRYITGREGSKHTLYGQFVAVGAYTPVSGEILTVNLVISTD